jgi:hypothetical protein
MPTFSPKSEARGRALEAVFWATAAAIASRAAMAAKIFLVIAEPELYPTNLVCLSECLRRFG